MPTIRVASVNGEWMNSWFGPDAAAAAFVPKFKLPGGGDFNDTAKAAGKLAAAIKAIDPDILALEEAPSRKAELDLFITEFLSTNGVPRYASILGDSGGAQKLAVLFKPSMASASIAPSSELATLLDTWEADVDGSMHLGPYQFTRTPLVVNLEVQGHALQVVVLHTKSSFVNNGRSLWNDPARRQDYVIAALKARRRNATEGMRVRQYLDEKLAATPDARIIVLGDLNDGPGMDLFEQKYLAHNITDIVLGSGFDPEGLFAHAQHDVAPDERYTAVFDDFVEAVPGKRLLLDHILLSPALAKSGTGLRRVAHSGTIHHQEFESLLEDGGARRDGRPSDHRPVSVRLKF
jgi:endonuclease/exonuclease/phosphatase family metal-dependent hydrolase